MRKRLYIVLTFLTVLLVSGCTKDSPIEPVNHYYPEIMTSVEYQSYEKGDLYTPLEGFLVFDTVDGDITDQVELKGLPQLGLDDDYQITKSGSFTITYVYTNSGGNSIQKSITVNVSIPYDESGLDYQLVWSDEFDYTGLPDSSKWYLETGGSGWGNGESQYYTRNDADNAYVSDGYLTITAIKEQYNNNEYTSARLNSTNEGSFLYGRFDIMAKLPSGTGVWPAIWMLPTNWEYGNWPASGEIDIMEYVGYDVNTIYYTIHTAAYNHMQGTQIGGHDTYSDVSNTFHKYSLEWLPDVLVWYIDDVEVFRYSVPTGANVDSTTWPFDIEFHLMLNIAVGGSWGGAQGVNDDIFPQEMVIDYVRVYQATNLD